MGLLNFFKKGSAPSYANAKNEGLRAISKRFRGSNEDTVFVTTSRLCPTCSMYNRRIFSLFGHYKAFPILPAFLHNDVCPTCGVHIGYSHYFPGINGNLKKDIAYSNKPFRDCRSSEEKALWNEKIRKEQLNNKMEHDYNWIVNNLPDLAPKSIGGYKRMVGANSKNYQKIVSAAKAKDYTI